MFDISYYKEMNNPTSFDIRWLPFVVN